MDGRYPTRETKLWLALQSAKTAKTISVKLDGIGEEIPFTIFGWVDDKLVAVCQTGSVYTDRMLRFHGIAHTASILRRGWGATAYTFVAEGFCVLEQGANNGEPLAKQFAEGNPAIAECLTFMHVERDSINIFTLPYKYGVGRNVAYANLHRLEDGDENAYQFPMRLQRFLDENTINIPDDKETYYETLANGLTQMGIMCEWWDE